MDGAGTLIALRVIRPDVKPSRRERAPVAPRATVAIRKRARLVYTLDDYLEREQISAFHAEVVRKAIAERLNVGR